MPKRKPSLPLAPTDRLTEIVKLRATLDEAFAVACLARTERRQRAPMARLLLREAIERRVGCTVEQYALSQAQENIAAKQQ